MSSGAESLSTKTRREREGAGEAKERENDFWLWRPFSARSVTWLPYGACGNVCVQQERGRWDKALSGPWWHRWSEPTDMLKAPECPGRSPTVHCAAQNAYGASVSFLLLL